MTAEQGRPIVLALVFVAVILAMSVGYPAGAQIIADVVDLGQDGGGVAVNSITSRVYVAAKGQMNVYDAQSHALVTEGFIAVPSNGGWPPRR